jgi:hypothetical protein
MPDSTTNSGPTDLVWDSFKEHIKTLYLKEDKTLDEVKMDMATKYQFSATLVPMRPNLLCCLIAELAQQGAI